MLLCPGNEHTTPPEISRVTEDGKWIIRNFPNKFNAVGLDYPKAYGSHEVIVETPKHGERLPQLSDAHFVKVLGMYAQRIKKLQRVKGIRYVLIFKNEGLTAGASLYHSHTQLVSLDIVPPLVQEELRANKRDLKLNGKCGFCDMVEKEGARVVYEDERVFAFCPYASRFSFETWIMPKRHVGSLVDLDEAETLSLAKALKRVLGRMDALLNNPPYNYLFHIAPKGAKGKGFHFHIEICPRLNVWAGFELGSEIIINPLPPEQAAGALR